MFGLFILFRYRLFFIVILLCFHLEIYAQTPCVQLNVQSDAPAVIPCDSNGFKPITFNATTKINNPANESNQYSVFSIPYSPLPWTGANTILANQDDVWSNVITLPFPFCFFGNTYTAFVVGSNGRISFDLSLAGQFDDYDLKGPPKVVAPHTASNSMNNTIMGPYHDIDPDVGGTISWDTIGQAPCRKMVISWSSVPSFLCGAVINRHQVVLNEFNNQIDINIANKGVCNAHNDALAIEGIQNANGTVAYTVPGRNSTSWSASNDSWRFQPSGNPYTYTTSYKWIDLATNTQLGVGSSFTLNAPFPERIICEATIIGGCNNAVSVLRDTTKLNIPKLNAQFSYQKKLGCSLDTVLYMNMTSPSTLTSYFWDFGDASYSSLSNPSHVYGAQKQYYVRLVARHPICIDDTTNSVIIDLNHPIIAGFAIHKDSICIADSILLTNTSTTTGINSNDFQLFTSKWDFGDGTTLVSNNQDVRHQYTQSGAYTIKLIITDSLGCQDSIMKFVYVDDFASQPGEVLVSASPSQVCLGEPIYFKNRTGQGIRSTEYNFGDGNNIFNVSNPIHTYSAPGIYTVEYTGYYSVCPDSVASTTVTVNSIPLLNLGEDTAICPGKTEAIMLSNLVNSNDILIWSTGVQASSLSVSDVGYYWARSINGSCEATDSIWVKRACYLNIPNSFSPNGDGLNDYFIPRQLLSEGLVSFKMKIFNRWGNLIFSTTSLDGRGWDGRYNGKKQAIGVYVYLIEAEWENNHKNTFQGTLSLIR